MIKCPYCDKSFKMLTSNHLKKHNKTLQECKKENPEIHKKWYPCNNMKNLITNKAYRENKGVRKCPIM